MLNVPFPPVVLPWPVDKVEVNVVHLEIAYRFLDGYFFVRTNGSIHRRLMNLVLIAFMMPLYLYSTRHILDPWGLVIMR